VKGLPEQISAATVSEKPDNRAPSVSFIPETRSAPASNGADETLWADETEVEAKPSPDRMPRPFSSVSQVWHWLQSLSGRLPQALNWVRFGSFCALMLGALLVLFQGQLGLIERSYVVQARVTAARVVFAGNQNIWRLADSTLCEATTTSLLDHVAESRPTCGAFHKEAVGKIHTIEWPNGSEAVLSMGPDRCLRIASAGKKVEALPPPDSFLLVCRDGWRQSGALVFVGSAILGETMASGQRNFLIDGRYEVRERGIPTSWFINRSHLADEGQLMRGERVEFVSDRSRNAVYGHITPSENDDDSGFHAVMISSGGASELEVSFFGRGEPVRIRPSWIESLGTNPILIALMAVIGILAHFKDVLPKEQNRG
jgi:hypothetical protein